MVSTVTTEYTGLTVATFDEMIDVLAAVFPAKVGIYASAPITSGLRSFSDEWADVRDVIRPNLHDARTFASTVRRHYGPNVIDPSRLPFIQHWEQSDYYNLWAQVVVRYAALAVFIDGWEYSRGCTNEFVVAVLSGVPTVNQNFEPLTPTAGAQLMERARQCLSASGRDWKFLGERLATLTVSPSAPVATRELPVAGAGVQDICFFLLRCVMHDRTGILAFPGIPAEPLTRDTSHAGQESRNLSQTQGARVVEEFRKSGKVVVDTSAFAPASWRASHLMRFWRRVLLSYISHLVLPGDWQHSRKIVELLPSAYRLGCTVSDLSGRKISATDAVMRLREAAAERRSGSMDTLLLYQVARWIINVTHDR